MVDIEYLKQLLPLLKSNGVASIVMDGCMTMEFHGEQPPKPEVLSTQDHTVHVPINEASLPPDLRTDAITDYDKILNWSGAPDEESIPIQGVNDQPIYPQEHLPVDPP